MECSLRKKVHNRKTRAMRVRKHVRGSQEIPRLSVMKTNQHLYAQLIDDEGARTLASTSTIAKEFRTSEFNRKNKTAGKQIGLKIAELAKNVNVKKVIFDRGPFKYHGILAAVADGAREGGLEF